MLELKQIHEHEILINEIPLIQDINIRNNREIVINVIK